MTERQATLVELTVPDDVQRERLEQRGENASVVESRVGPRTPGYDDDLHVDLVIDTADLSPHAVAELIAAQVGGVQDR
jgi:ribose 1,5-bisphosphokinase PhnN